MGLQPGLDLGPTQDLHGKQQLLRHQLTFNQ